MNKSKRELLDIKLDTEEQEIEDALPEFFDQLPITANLAEELALAKSAAANYLRKNQRINIRLSDYDVSGLKRIAVREGLAYQTLIASVLHKYVVSHLCRQKRETG